jgi:hypothetical protein
MVRLAGVNTPEIGEDGYEEAKEFVNCIPSTFYKDF